MLSWQKRLRAVLGLSILILGAAIFIAVRARRGDEQTDPPPRVATDTTIEVKGGEYTHTRDGRVVFTLRFKQQLTYPDGRTLLQGVAVRFPDREGRTFILTAREARQTIKEGSRIGALAVERDVKMTGDDGLTVETDSAFFDESSDIVRAPGKVTFARGRVSGSGLGATYDHVRDTLWLLDQAHVVVAADEAGQGAMTVDAGAAGLARRDRYIRFERGVTMTGSTQSAAAHTATVFLAAAEDRLDRVELSGNASVTGAPEGGSGLRAMRAQRITLDYAADGRTLERALLNDAASVDLASSGATRTLSGGTIDASLGPGGQAVTSLAAATDVVLVLPAETSAPARRIQSATLTGRGDAQGIRTLEFGGGVEYRESLGKAGGGAGDRRATSETLAVSVKPGFGAAQDAHFAGRVSFRDGAVRAEAPDARYALEKATIQLSAGDGRAPATPPHVEDDRVAIDARAIDLAVGAKRLTADGDVRSVLQPATDEAAMKGRQTPAMLTREEPVNVTAAKLAYDGDAGRATYTGGARLWQGETTIQGDLLELDDKAGNLVVKGHARSRLLLEATGKDAKKADTLARGDHLLYDNAARKATYEGHADVRGPQGDVSADRIELFLDESGRALDHAEAYANVTARFDGGQRATGERLTYLAAGERYTMTGTPVRILEKVGEGCRETIGATLTFVRSTDTISVVGSEGSRSQTKPEPCAELR
jgi:lipopolysaccharide export system protein LptA